LSKVPQKYENFYKKAPAEPGLFTLHIQKCIVIISLSRGLTRFTLRCPTWFKQHGR